MTPTDARYRIGIYSLIVDQVNSGGEDSVNMVKKLLIKYPFLDPDFKQHVERWSDRLFAVYNPHIESPNTNLLDTSRPLSELVKEINKEAELLKNSYEQSCH